MPLLFLRFEGLALFCLSLYLFHSLEGSWWMFAALFFVPDVGLIGYVWGRKIGAIFYNLLHTEVAPMILVGASLWLSIPLLLQIALIWFCHINFDRMLGIGLKYLDDFKHTHLGTMSLKRKDLQ